MIEAIADRILIKPINEESLLYIPGERGTNEGEIVSVGPECGNDIRMGAKVIFKKSLHPTLEGLLILREDQILAEI